jgi:hypothetical protein
MGTLKWIGAALLGGLLTFGFVGCGSGSSSDGNTGTMSLALTDAPIAGIEHVKEVNVTITSIEYSKDGEAWQNFDGFSGPQMFNLLELREGNVAALGDTNLTAGHYTQIRLHLDATEENGNSASNPGCFITYDNSEEVTPLFIPSGEQTGIKLIGEYDVPVNGVISLVIDFDVQKSIVKSGNSGNYKLKPTLRLIVDDEAGHIMGNVLNESDYNLTVYAYEDGTYDANESNESAAVMFPNAVTSVDLHQDGNFKLAFLAAGSYDLVLAEYNASSYEGIYGYINDVIVNSGETTNLGTATVEATY